MSRSTFHVSRDMLDIYKVVLVLKKLPFEIECIHAYGKYYFLTTCMSAYNTLLL